MWIVINISGKQEIVRINQVISIDYKKNANIFDIILLNRILLFVDLPTVLVGTPIINDRKVVTIVIQHCFGKKIVVLRFKRKKHYKKIKGFKPKITKLLVKNII